MQGVVFVTGCRETQNTLDTQRNRKTGAHSLSRFSLEEQPGLKKSYYNYIFLFHPVPMNHLVLFRLILQLLQQLMVIL